LKTLPQKVASTKGKKVSSFQKRQKVIRRFIAEKPPNYSGGNEIFRRISAIKNYPALSMMENTK
jgi:hypothetical protein